MAESIVQSTGVYDLEYFCLTNENFILVKRQNSILQITPSEFKEGDLLPCKKDGEFSWTIGFLTKREVPANDSIVELNTQRGTFFLTPGHKLFKKDGSLEAAGNLKKGDALDFCDFVLPSDQSIGKDLAFLLGAFLTEGTAQQGVCKKGTGRWRAEFCLHYEEVNFANQISSAIKQISNNFNPIIKSYEKWTRRIVGVYSKEFVQFLESLGALGFCYEKRIPGCLFTATQEEKSAFIAAAFLGDGSWNRRRITYKTTSKAIADGLHLLLSSLGIKNNISYECKKRNKNTYLITIYNKENIGLFIEKTKYWISNWKWFKTIESYYSEREKAGKLTGSANLVNSVKFLTLEKTIEVYDFTVPVYENFLLNTIVSHNSGSQMFLYIGDVWVDEITSLQYTRSQNKTPIYGYASQLFDDLAAGQVIIQGSFSINFKEQGYLWAVLRRWKNITLAEALAGTDPITGRDMTRAEKALLRAGKRSPIVWNEQAGNHTAIQRQSIERVVQEKTTTAEAYKFYSDLAGYASYDPRMKGKAKDTLFEDIMENFEDQVWRTDISDENLKAQIRNPDDNLFDNFDMYVVMGNYASRGTNHTVSRISNVSLTSQGKLVKIDGEPIQEIYEFLAQTTY